jgi:hypothetical protein
MKNFFPFFIVAAGALLSGCALSQHGLTLAPVGPAPEITSKSADGNLIVFSAIKRNADFNRRDPYRPEYSDYRILTANGDLLRNVHNNTDTIFQDVVSVALPPGSYQVVARANGYGYVTVPVIVSTRHDTVLHLEGGYAWSDESVFNQTNATRLPDGRIVGWSAVAN